MFHRFLLIALIFLSLTAAMAQDRPEPTPVEIPAADGLALKGDFYAAGSAESPAPAVLLMHMYGSQRLAWGPILPALIEGGYSVLNVDLRGFGETGGDEDWAAAEGDVQTWLDWLRAQDGIRPDAIATLGASVGSNLALVGCANDEACVTAIALSPGLDFYNVQPETAVVEGLRRRSALLVTSQGDGDSAEAVKQMVASARGEITAVFYNGSAHGTGLFSSARLRGQVTTAILDWLGAKLNAPEG
jgi:pimeloyl-ACP methyl ester carboxylesterase